MGKLYCQIASNENVTFSDPHSLWIELLWWTSSVIYDELDGAVVTRWPFTAMTRVRVRAATAAAWLRFHATHGMYFTLHSWYLVYFSLGFSSTFRRAQNCSDSDWDSLIRLKMDWRDVALGGHKTQVWISFALYCMCVTSKTLSASVRRIDFT